MKFLRNWFRGNHEQSGAVYRDGSIFSRMICFVTCIQAVRWLKILNTGLAQSKLSIKYILYSAEVLGQRCKGSSPFQTSSFLIESPKTPLHPSWTDDFKTYLASGKHIAQFSVRWCNYRYMLLPGKLLYIYCCLCIIKLETWLNSNMSKVSDASKFLEALVV